MKSIRLSLVCYFLVLLTAALGAVCWLAYRTAAAALDERRQGSRHLVESQYRAHCEEINTVLDRRLLQKAQIAATMARPPIHVEALYPFGAVAVMCTSAPHLQLGLWLHEGIPNLRMRDKELSLAELLYRFRTAEVDIEAAESLILRSSGGLGDIDGDAESLGPPPGHAQEYFQVFLNDGRPSSRSHSLGTATLQFDPRLLASAFPQPQPDTVELKPGVKVRRVTIKTRMVFRKPKGVDKAAPSFSAHPWRWWAILAPAASKRGMGKAPGPPPGPFFGPGGPFIVRDFYIQYAIDRAPTEAKLQQYAEDRDRQLGQIDADTASQLLALRNQFFWIALATFAATLVGGYLLLLLGLAPLARLSEAVSEVSERDFRLKIDPEELPAELKPIAERMSRTLEQLGKAFDREKQAAADISHELRTPLAALMTTVEVALRKARSVQEYHEILADCQASGQHMSHLVERLLALARLDAGADRSRPRAVDAAQLAVQCADLVRPLAKARGLTLTAHIAPALPLATDPDKLCEVLTNLLNNAVEYNRPGGAIDLTVGRFNGDLCVEVRDTGIGIGPEARARIFERFYRADPSRHADIPHSGLGLAIVKSYVDLLGGTIAVDSVPQQGTTFRVRLPVQEIVPEQQPLLA
jgi:two-component system, OmpR family, heavy metal sensor histidine kinase CusS